MNTADTSRALSEERDFLLESLRDLEAEHDAGEIEDADYERLRNEYTARAAAVIRDLESTSGSEGDAALTSAEDEARPKRSNTVLIGACVVLVALVAGFAVTQAAGRRSAGENITGEDVAASTERLDDCFLLEREADVEAADECYGEVIEAQPASVDAHAFRGWMWVREGELERGLADLDTAVELAPESTAPRVFRAVGRMRSGDPTAALADLAAFVEGDPPAQERELAEGLLATVVDGALDECVAGEGSDPIDETLACYENALTVDPDHPAALAYQGWLFVRARQTESGLANLDRAIDLAPDEPIPYVFRAVARAQAGDAAGALADLDTVASLDPPPEVAANAATVRAAIEAGEDPTP